jgi:dihydroxy-acid dehydratase
MLNGRWRDQQIGSGTHVWKFDAMVRAGELSLQDFMDAGTLARQPDLTSTLTHTHTHTQYTHTTHHVCV